MEGSRAVTPLPVTHEKCFHNFLVDKTPLKCLVVLLEELVHSILEGRLVGCHLVPLDLEVLACFLVAVVVVVLKAWTLHQLECQVLEVISHRTHLLSTHSTSPSKNYIKVAPRR